MINIFSKPWLEALSADIVAAAVCLGAVLALGLAAIVAVDVAACDTATGAGLAGKAAAAAIGMAIAAEFTLLALMDASWPGMATEGKRKSTGGGVRPAVLSVGRVRLPER